MIPAPGRILVKPIETAETLNGGRILLTENVREHWTLGQAEVIAVGAAAVCEDEDCECEGLHVPDPRLKPGSWVLCKPRTFVQVEDGYLVTVENVVGVFTAPVVQTPT